MKKMFLISLIFLIFFASMIYSNEYMTLQYSLPGEICFKLRINYTTVPTGDCQKPHQYKFVLKKDNNAILTNYCKLCNKEYCEPYYKYFSFPIDTDKENKIEYLDYVKYFIIDETIKTDNSLICKTHYEDWELQTILDTYTTKPNTIYGEINDDNFKKSMVDISGGDYFLDSLNIKKNISKINISNTILSDYDNFKAAVIILNGNYNRVEITDSTLNNIHFYIYGNSDIYIKNSSLNNVSFKDFSKNSAPINFHIDKSTFDKVKIDGNKHISFNITNSNIYNSSLSYPYNLVDFSLVVNENDKYKLTGIIKNNFFNNINFSGIVKDFSFNTVNGSNSIVAIDIEKFSNNNFKLYSTITLAPSSYLEVDNNSVIFDNTSESSKMTFFQIHNISQVNIHDNDFSYIPLLLKKGEKCKIFNNKLLNLKLEHIKDSEIYSNEIKIIPLENLIYPLKGIELYYCDNLSINKNLIVNNLEYSDTEKGLLINGLKNSNILNNKVLNFYFPIYQENGDNSSSIINNEFSGNIISFLNSQWNGSILFKSINNNKIFNNIFKNVTIKIYSTYCGENYKNCENQWYVNPQNKRNIAGGSKIGGNYWEVYDNGYIENSEFKCIDVDEDGFCDDNLTAPGIFDKYPLKAYSSIYISKTNKFDNSVWSKKNPLIALNLQLTNFILSKGKAKINSIAFNYIGSGSINDIEKAVLYYDKDCTGAKGEKLGASSFSNGKVVFNIDKFIDVGEDSCFILGYYIKDIPEVKTSKYCACANYGATVKENDINAEIMDEKISAVGKAEGSTNANYPDVEFVNINDSTLFALVNKKCSKPLKVKISNLIHNECYDNGEWNAVFSISKEDVPQGATGYYFEYKGIVGTEVEVPFDKNGIAEINFKAGDKQGNYKIHVKPRPSSSNPYICPSGDYTSEILFNVKTGDIKLIAKYDGTQGGSEDSVIGTFISTQDVENIFTIEKDFPSGFNDLKIKSITYIPENWDEDEKKITIEPFKVSYNMKNLKINSKLKLQIEFENGDITEKEYGFYVIEIPDWVETFNGKPYTGIEWGFNEEEKRYEVNLTFPNEGIKWIDPIPDWVGILGGEEDEEEFSVTAQAAYHINQTSSLAGLSKYNGKILGKPLKAEGEIRLFFDKEFQIKKDPAGYAKLKGEVEFETEKKTLAEKTVLVYGIPITFVVEAGGKLTILADGKVIFKKDLTVKEATFVPGVAVALILDASASVLKGAAKLGMRSIPTALLQIKLKYTTDYDKVFPEKFGLKVSVTVQVYGSLFWGVLSKDPLGEAEYGPWIYGDAVGAASYIEKSMKKVAKSSNTGKIFSTGSVDIDSSGNNIMVYVADKGNISPDIYYIKGNSQGWVTNNSDRWELDPDVVFMKDGKALTIWTSNDADKSLDNLSIILNYQDIAYSIYNGYSWSQEELIIDDDYRDGVAKLAYEKESNKAMAVWVHNTSKEKQTDGTNLALMYSVFNESDDNKFGEPLILPGTNNNTLDYQVSVSPYGNGKFIVVWVHDEDGKMFTKLDKIQKGTDVDTTNSDCNIFYSIYDTQSKTWTTPSSITSINYYTEKDPAVAVSEDTIVVTWVEKTNANIDNLYISVYDKEKDKWTTALLDSTNGIIENPNVSISDNVAKVLYRKTVKGESGIFLSEKNITEIYTSGVKVKKLSNSQGLWINGKIAGENIALISTSANTGKSLKVFKPEDFSAEILSDNISIEKYDNSSGKYKGILLKIPLTFKNNNTMYNYSYKLKATLAKVNGIEIETAVSKQLNSSPFSDVLTGEILFDGKRINEMGFNGENLIIKNIQLIGLMPDEIILDEVKNINTGLIVNSEDFIMKKARFTKNVYEEGGEIEVEVDDSEADNVTVYVESENFIGNEIELSKQGEIFKTSFTPSELGINNSGLIKLFYMDKSGKIWRDSCLWMKKPLKAYDLNVKIINNFSEKNFVKGANNGIYCPANCYESIDKDTEVTLTVFVDNESEFFGWDGVNCDNTSTECTFTMDNDTEITAYFKKKGPEYIEDTTGDISEEGKSVIRTMNISSGWSLISLPVEGEFSTGEKFASSSTIWGWSGNSWEVWSGDANIINLLNQYKITILSKLESGKGYWLNSGNDFTEKFEGTSYGKDKINLTDGWNLVGCGVKLKASDFGEAKTLWQWTGSNWKVWSPIDSIIALLNQYKIEIVDEIKAGEGFWVNK